MTAWGVAKAKAQFSAVLDKAKTEGPQLVRRRKEEFFVVTKAQLAQEAPALAADKPFVSAWDALRPSSELLFDYDFPRHPGKPRAAKF